MEVIESLSTPSGGTIQLCWGDLAGLGPADGCDLIVVSAFRGDYLATPGSVIGALSRTGLSVAELAVNKDVDLRSSTSCWLSREIPGNRGTRGFDRILLYEPISPSSAAETVGDVFRALVPFVGTKAMRDVAMPVLSTGDMRRRHDEMLPAILSAAWHWMTQGLELDRLRIVIRSQREIEPARTTFREFARQHRPDRRPSSPASDERPSSRRYIRIPRRVQNIRRRLRSQPAEQTQPSTYDAFISYAREDGRDVVDVIEREMTELAPHIRLFVDDQSIDVGSPWQGAIQSSIATCRKFVAVSTAGFWESPVCLDEWNMANLMRYESDDNFIFPIEAKTCESQMKLLFQTLNYRDCKEADRKKLREACKALAAELSN